MSLREWVAEVAVLCGLSFPMAYGHTYSQLRLMEAAAIRAEARRMQTLISAVRVAVNGEAKDVTAALRQLKERESIR